MTSPKLSIIIPVFNLEKYIAATLDNIFSQSFADFEVIAVNDGSTDSSGTILDTYAAREARLKVIHKANGGVTSARLRGVQEANGEYIGFVDGDDTIDEDMYELLVANAEKYDADISHCGYKMVFPSRTDLYHGSGKIIEQNTFVGLKDLLDGSLVEPGLCNKIYRKALFEDILNGNCAFDTGVRINEDLLMNYFLFKASSHSVFEDVCKYNYIVRAGSAANSDFKPYKLTDPIKVAQIIKKDAASCPELKTVINRMYSVRLISAAIFYSEKSPDIIQPIKKDAQKKLRAFVVEFCKNSSESQVKKVFVCLAAFAPETYRIIHRLYRKIKGTDKIYEIS